MRFEVSPLSTANKLESKDGARKPFESGHRQVSKSLGPRRPNCAGPLCLSHSDQIVGHLSMDILATGFTSILRTSFDKNLIASDADGPSRKLISHSIFAMPENDDPEITLYLFRPRGL